MKKITISLFIFSIILAISCQKSEFEVSNFLKKKVNARVMASSTGVEVIPLSGTANGYTYTDLAIATTKWWAQLPLSQDPWSDEDGSSLGASFQPLTNVMILPSNNGGESERWVTIPANHTIFMPVLGVSAWKYELDPCDPWKIKNDRASERVLGKYGRRFLNGAKNLTATINGQNIVNDFSNYRITTGYFKSIIHSDYNPSSCDYTGIEADILFDYYALYMKLPPGQHTLYLAGEMSGGIPFHSKVTWHLNVE